MKILLALVPFLALAAGLILYKHNGKREILRFDLVQFFYAFILLPALYVWMKGFLFVLLESQLGQTLSQQSLLFWDTVYSILFLFLYAFTVIHSLTKSFQLKRDKDPLYDLFEHSEYYHSWVSHTVVYVGGMILFFSLAALNAWIDLPWPIRDSVFHGLLAIALGTAALIFKSFLISDFGDFRFVKLMNLLSAFFFVLCIVVYALTEPSFAGAKAMYWFQLTVFLGLSLLGLTHDSDPEPAPFHKRILKNISRFWSSIVRRI